MPRALNAGTVVVIPARYESKRFPGKPLALIAGVSLVERTWRQTCKAVQSAGVYIATDDERIAEHARSFGANVVMTSSAHSTGTDRCHEVATKLNAQLLVNVQCDEPMIDPNVILTILDHAEANSGVTVNAMSPIETEEDFRSPSVPKVVAALDGRLLYMSRGAVPTDKDLSFRSAMRQVCVYAFPRKALQTFASPSGKTPLEAMEDIEILRLVERGVTVQMVEVKAGSIAVDFPEDVARVETLLASRNSQ